MIITRKSAFTGKVHSMDLPVTKSQMNRWAQGSALIQDAFPFLTDNEREFILTGITPEEWADAFPPEPED